MTAAPARGMLDLRETDEFTFDAEAADRPCRFIEKFCQHYEGQFAGQSFKLHPLQRRIVGDLFGWRWRSTGLRRFTDAYLEGAIGSGKSPLLAALGLYGLMADGEEGAQVYSLASSFGQARVVYDCAKRFVQASDDLSRCLETTQYEIRHRPSNSFWRVVSKHGPGAGCRPSLVLGDEVHQWPGPSGYKDLRDRMSKRREPLLIAATNAGTSQVSFCWQLREKAVAALAGTGDPGLYPIIWSAAEDAETDDPAAWREANPLVGVTIAESKIRALCDEAVKDPVAETDFRRLYLGLWPKTVGGRWLDLATWDACSLWPTDGAPADAPLYIGVDLAQSDDLSAVVYVWVTPARFYVGSHFWIPEPAAERYASHDSIPYFDWADAGHITILDSPTVDSAARKQIAAAVVAQARGHKVKAVCYDRYKADETVAALEAAGLTCVPVAQGYTISPGCHELDRRLKEGSIVVAPNPVLRWNAENAEVKSDDRGNIWPIKPHAKGKYAGKRGLKIDGISALVTALTEARKFVFPNTKQSKAQAWSV